ncbi:MAG TPA: valine--tRNA ligase [Candidatus Marinimicrobia bacterium]|nr:valine--tRNA ligase [Candidatus Neomarinimicrobiota bacterium]
MSTPTLEKTYNPANVEDKWYGHWLEKNYFHADPNSDKEPYTIVIPPPNVTGMLTVGHVLNNTIQDILIRKARMEGKEACWVPGTDHASIATEAKVVAMLKEKGIKKSELSREEFLEYAWEWKEKYGGIIIRQLKKLGCSCDWERERFTMDEGYTKAVLSAFVQLYEKGFIYKGYRLVNWCPVSKSAISDEEVIHQEVNGNLWHFRYPIIGSDEYLVVATTRPETMLGDTAVAIHPNDERFQHLIGKTVTLPLVGREIPIISDDYVDPEFGTGCVKVTPAHDPNDFAMGERHDLEFINIMNDDASLNSNVPNKYVGLSREDARKAVVNDLKSKGLLEKTEDYTNKVGYSERGHVPIESYMSEQWFMKMSDLAKPALDAVNNGEIKFHPDHWKKTYNHWMENIKDWCISRQLWWGHQIPVWIHKEDSTQIHVSVDGPNDPENWDRDPDVLDTWASSWLWPMGVHSWPEGGNDLKKFYPTDVVVTGPDIIFFWVARMIMTGYEFMDDLPFKDVYFTSILRDETGRKLSKSLGNSPDPFDLFDEYGTDAVRFGIMLMAPQGLDVLFSKDRLEIGRNFMNKLWNACRFIQMNIPENWNNELDIDSAELDLSDKWILSRLSKTIDDYNRQLDRFHFNEAAKVLYEFTWNDFCDWYVEIAKTRFYGNDEGKADITRTVSLKCIRTVLALLHPYSPFITEDLWSHFKAANALDLIVDQWPERDFKSLNDNAEKEMVLLQKVVTAIRSIRSRMNVPPSKFPDLVVRCDDDQASFLENHRELLKSLARIGEMTLGESIEKPGQSATAVVGGMEMYILLEGLVDLNQEKSRMGKRIGEINRLITGINGKLSNENFINRAPEHVVAKERTNLDRLTEELEKVTANLEMLQ